jgi:hypothetical protein
MNINELPSYTNDHNMIILSPQKYTKKWDKHLPLWLTTSEQIPTNMSIRHIFSSKELVS